MHATKRMPGFLAGAILLAVAMPALPASAADTPQAVPAPAVAPLRLVTEAMGGQVTWDAERRTVTGTLGTETFTVAIGRTDAAVGGRAVTLSQAPEIVDGRTEVPLSLFTDSLKLDPKAQETARAISFVAALSRGQGESYGPQLTPALAQVLPAPVMRAVGASLQKSNGAIVQVSVTGYTANAVHESVSLRVAYAKLPMTVSVRFTPAGALDDFFMAPDAGAVTPAPAPAYATPAAYTEQDAVVGQGTFALPGTLTLPAGAGPFPAVVLVQGSGPSDRDESVGGVKPFRDLADGLASQGIAVLRYEKRTHEHSQKSGANPKFDLNDETIADAVAAVNLLGSLSQIDPHRIFALGHSLGGFAMPQIISRATVTPLAGAVIMAGPDSLLDDLVQQNQILADAGLVSQQNVALVASQVALLKDPAFDPAHAPASFILGKPYYYASWRGSAAARLLPETTPVLFLQGMRDCQVPVAQLYSWKAALAGRTDVTYRLYPKLNHMFTEGDGPLGLPDEYNTPANVPAYVVNDIADWVRMQ